MPFVHIDEFNNTNRKIIATIEGQAGPPLEEINLG